MQFKKEIGKWILNFLLTLIMVIGLMTGMNMKAHATGDHYLMFTGTESFSMQAPKKWDGKLYYSTDASTWTEWDGSSVSSADNVLYFRGTGNTKITEYSIFGSSWRITSEGTVSCSGDIRTLLDYENPENATMGKDCFQEMFKGCTILTKAPELPATTLAESCYGGMFYGCSSLTEAPNLPATTLARYCYGDMFYGCSSLTEAPNLPATTLADRCYIRMFKGCTGLTEAPDLPATTLTELCYSEMFSNCTGLIVKPELPATTLAKHCYYWMFAECTSLKEAPELPATTLAEYCYAEMFSGCTSLSKAPDLPATALADYCYNWMFYGCTSLKEAPELPATTLAEYCYAEMFSGCTSLSKVPDLPATALTVACYNFMFDGCSSLINAPELPASILTEHCYDEMFNGCTSLKKAPSLPATTLAESCYEYMFSGCTSLTEAPELPATTLAKSCYSYMFAGCEGLIKAPKLPATTLADYCYGCMFNGCTSLTKAPGLPATTLADGCYVYMFSVCTGLEEAPELPATALTAGCYERMFAWCTSLKEAPELPASTLAKYCYSGMFMGCTSLTKAPELSVTTLAPGCFSYMFSECTGIKISETKTDEYATEYRIPTGGTGIMADGALEKMFAETGGTFTGTPDINKTYYMCIPVSKYTVTFKVVNGSWNDGTRANKTVILSGYEGDIFKLKVEQIPTVGTKPADGYKTGSWNEVPSTSFIITEDKSYTYTYVAKNAAKVKKKPAAKVLTYNGFAQELVTAGVAEGGTVKYALGTDATTAPTASRYTASIPTGIQVGTYYVWYLVAGDENHKDKAPTVVTVSIVKADGPSAPTGLFGVSPSVKGAADGKLTGLSKNLEWATKEDFSDAKACTGNEVTGLTEGMYYVRMAETDTHLAGAAAMVLIEDGPEKIVYQEMYRLYNPNSGEHFYTANESERDYLDVIGWNYEGIAWNAPEVSGMPVYRLYNPNAGDHHYTTNAAERDMLVTIGWNDEGIGWYSDDAQSEPLYRLYNPNATQAGAHHYTTNAAERDMLVTIGWNDEGIGWYGGN